MVYGAVLRGHPSQAAEATAGYVGDYLAAVAAMLREARTPPPPPPPPPKPKPKPKPPGGGVGGYGGWGWPRSRAGAAPRGAVRLAGGQKCCRLRLAGGQSAVASPRHPAVLADGGAA